jgi:hypothetical protein
MQPATDTDITELKTAIAKLQTAFISFQIKELKAQQTALSPSSQTSDSHTELSFAEAIALNHRTAGIDPQGVAVDRQIRKVMAECNVDYTEAYRRVNPQF